MDDLPNLISRTEILEYANRTWPANTTRAYFVRGRQSSKCAMISNTISGFVEGLTSCSSLLRSACQYIQPLAPEEPLIPTFTPSRCQFTGDIFEEGVYRISFCVVPYFQTYLLHRLSAYNYNMRLFHFSQTLDKKTLIDFSSAKWAWKDSSFFVDNRDAGGCNAIKHTNGSFVYGREDCVKKTLGLAEFRNLERECSVYFSIHTILSLTPIT
jgi:hypothetical protein